jgi:tripartite-type tricarboxylate transporter receptor subunit TctC
MNTLFKTLALAAVSMCMAVATPASAQAVKYPTQQVRIVVPFPPGGSTDALARLIGEKLSARWKQTVIVENKPGANTMLGTDFVAKAPADGHTLGIVTGSHVINPLLTSKLPYDSQKDLTGVMLLTGFHMALWAHPSLPANNPAELLALAKKEKVDYAAATTQSYLGIELLNAMAGVKLNYVPYKGSSQAINDLIGGHVQLMVDPVSQTMMEHVKAGKIKLVGVLGKRTTELAPGAGSFAAAVPGYDFSGAFGLVVRNGTPPEVIRFVRDEFATVMKMPEVAERIVGIGQEPLVSTPEDYNGYIRTETQKWAPVVKSTGATL